jgi:hypothetical protein
VEEELKFNRFMRFDTFQPDADWSELRVTVLPNLNLLDGLASVNNFDPLVPGRFAHWMDRLDEMDPAQKDKLVNLMAVGAVGRMDLTMGTPFQFQPLWPGARIRWAPCGIAVQGAEKAWQMVASGTVNFDQNVVLESESENSASDCPDSQPVPEFSLVSENPNRLEIRIDTSESGWLVISDTWYPGWRASVDGADVPVVRANYLFRAVPVSAGEHQVVFSYQPASFYAGLVLLLLVASILVISWRRGSG